MAEMIGGTTGKRSTRRAIALEQVVANSTTAVDANSTTAVNANSTSSHKKAKNKWAVKLKELDEMKPTERAEALDSDDGFCVAEDITLEEFHEKCDAMEKGTCNPIESRWCFRMEFRDGKAWIYEIPQAVHDRAAQQVMRLIDRGLGAHADDVLMASSPV